MEWLDCPNPLHPPGGLDSKLFDAMKDITHIQIEDEVLGQDCFWSFATTILDAKYEWTNVAEVIDKLTHLIHQKADLLQVLHGNEKMFDGTLGVYQHKKVHIDIDPDPKPVHARPYPVPSVHLSTFEKELDHLVKLGVIVPQQQSQWVSPTFIVSKKDGRVCWISDLHQLNEIVRANNICLLNHNWYYRKCAGFEFFTKLNISMQYYMLELDKESQDLCAIMMPFGK